MRCLVLALFLIGCSGSSASIAGPEQDAAQPQEDAAPDSATAPDVDAGIPDAAEDVVYIDGYVCPFSPTYEPAVGPVTKAFRYSSAGPVCDNQCGAGGNVKYVVDEPGTIPDLLGCTRQKESGHFCCPDAVCVRDAAFDAQCVGLNQPPKGYSCDGQPGNLPKPSAGCEAFNGTGGAYIYCCP
jgi:hypothetical protein